MKGFKDLTKELSELKDSMENLTAEIHEVNFTIKESLKLTSDTMKELSKNFSKTMADVIENLSKMKVQMDIKDSILKNLGIDAMLPDFLKKKK
jgi:methyl-accepting chemotaxis protein